MIQEGEYGAVTLFIVEELTNRIVLCMNLKSMNQFWRLPGSKIKHKDLHAKYPSDESRAARNAARDLAGKIVNFYVDDEYLFSATIGKSNQIKVSKDSEIGRAVIKALVKRELKAFVS